MLYSLVHKISVLAIKLFFNQISLQNKQIVPNQGPVIFVANHPNFFMDPLIAGSYCPRNLYFFAKSTLFNSSIKKWILTRLNLVPVYRKIDDEDNMVRIDMPEYMNIKFRQLMICLKILRIKH